mgnify:CR=1 FL=1
MPSHISRAWGRDRRRGARSCMREISLFVAAELRPLALGDMLSNVDIGGLVGEACGNGGKMADYRGPQGGPVAWLQPQKRGGDQTRPSTKKGADPCRAILQKCKGPPARQGGGPAPSPVG